MRIRTHTLIAIGALVCLIGHVSAQRPSSPGSAETKKGGPPSITAGGNFVSLNGRFSIGLPQQVSAFRGLSLPTPFGVAKGDAYQWEMKEASFVVGYAEASQPVEAPEIAAQVFNAIRVEFNKIASSNNGVVWKEKQLMLGKHPGIEQRLDLFSGFMVQRTYLVSSRLYQVVMVIKNSQREFEGRVAKTLDTFRLLNESEVSAKSAEAAVKAEPNPLPQQPVAPRIGSDASDHGLHDRVKTVLEESQDLSGTWSVQSRKHDSFDAYNEYGNLTRSEVYDYKGNLDEIIVYGYLEGGRVSQSKRITREYNPPAVVTSAPAATAKKYDPRYDTKHEFKYDEQRRLIEHAWFRSNGDRFLRYVYKYTGNQREELVYSENGSLNQRYISVLDDKGNEVERTSFDPRDGAEGAKYSYKYEFDSHGNWTKRTTAKVVGSELEPLYVDFRQITYY